MRRLLAICAICEVYPALCFAMTGAELLQADRTFATGYVFGVTEYRIGVLSNNDPQFTTVRNCVMNSKISAGTLYDVTVEYLKRNPKDLTLPAFGGVMNALAEMCVSK